MKVVNKLGQLLNIDEDEHGVISKIAMATGLSRHTVRAFLHNEAKSVSYETLAKVSQYLIDHENVDPAILPGALFGFAPNEFWPMLYERRRIEFCMGARRVPQWPDELVMAADSELQAKLTHRITQYSSMRNVSNDEVSSRDGQIFDQRLITAPALNGSNGPEIVSQSKVICEQFDAQKSDKSLICLGSVKCNSVIERLVAECFADTTVFESQNNVDTARERTCPFAIIFRESDPQLNSCCGGRQLARENPGAAPGIYFEGPEVEWTHVPSDEHNDGAIVFYRYHKSLCNLRMCLGGYSSRGTRFLADFLHSGNANGKLWPPTYDDGEIQVGLFVLQFTFDESGKDLHGGSVRGQKPHSTTVHAVSEEAIQRRIQPPAHKRGKMTQDDGSHERIAPR
jgi:transcriptional regulator with XRE-family HTH domain